MTQEEWRKEHDKHEGICKNCSPIKRNCCQECFHINLHGGLDYCSDFDCKCHKF